MHLGRICTRQSQGGRAHWGDWKDLQESLGAGDRGASARLTRVCLGREMRKQVKKWWVPPGALCPGFLIRRCVPPLQVATHLDTRLIWKPRVYGRRHIGRSREKSFSPRAANPHVCPWMNKNPDPRLTLFSLSVASKNCALRGSRSPRRKRGTGALGTR